MSAPPPAAPVSHGPTPASTSRQTESRRDRFLSPRIVAREAAKVLAAMGVEVRPAKLRRLVTRFIEEGHTTTDDLRTWVIAYMDPTGEEAVRNVVRTRGF